MYDEFSTLVDGLPILAFAEEVWFFKKSCEWSFDENEWREVLKNTPIMKTTYKFDKEELIPNSYLHKLFHGELNE